MSAIIKSATQCIFFDQVRSFDGILDNNIYKRNQSIVKSMCYLFKLVCMVGMYVKAENTLKDFRKKDFTIGKCLYDHGFTFAFFADGLVIAENQFKLASSETDEKDLSERIFEAVSAETNKSRENLSKKIAEVLNSNKKEEGTSSDFDDFLIKMKPIDDLFKDTIAKKVCILGFVIICLAIGLCLEEEQMQNDLNKSSERTR